MRHYEVILVLKNAPPARKGVIAKDPVEAITKAVAAVEGAVVSDVERVIALGTVDIT